MAVNKVIYNQQTLIDLTDLDVSASDIIQNKKAINKAGTKITGTLQIQKYYTGSTEPTSALGQNGDIYLKTEG